MHHRGERRPIIDGAPQRVYDAADHLRAETHADRTIHRLDRSAEADSGDGLQGHQQGAVFAKTNDLRQQVSPYAAESPDGHARNLRLDEGSNDLGHAAADPLQPHGLHRGAQAVELHPSSTQARVAVSKAVKAVSTAASTQP